MLSHSSHPSLARGLVRGDAFGCCGSVKLRCAMQASRNVMRRASELLDAGVPFALCTVVATRGSVPGKTGAKMIVLADGVPFGTVGGAGLEERTKEAGLRCLQE